MSLRVEETFELIERNCPISACWTGCAAGCLFAAAARAFPASRSWPRTVFQLPAFPAKTNSISGLKSALDQPEFATAIGLVKFGSLQQKRKRRQWADRRFEKDLGRNL